MSPPPRCRSVSVPRAIENASRRRSAAYPRSAPPVLRAADPQASRLRSRGACAASSPLGRWYGRATRRCRSASRRSWRYRCNARPPFGSRRACRAGRSALDRSRARFRAAAPRLSSSPLAPGLPNLVFGAESPAAKRRSRPVPARRGNSSAFRRVGRSSKPEGQLGTDIETAESAPRRLAAAPTRFGRPRSRCSGRNLRRHRRIRCKDA